MKVLCIPGVQQHSLSDITWQTAWLSAIQKALGADASVDFCVCDDLFVQTGLTARQTLDAITTLGGSAWNNLWRTRGLFDGDNIVGWTAGMVTQWAGIPDLREKTRDRLADFIKSKKPDIILAHSLGSLISYDLFTQHPELVNNRAFISFGSQINNSFVRGVFDGGIRPLPSGSLWFHLYNSDDWIFTESFGSDMAGADNFQQFDVRFNEGWIGSHSNIDRYLNDPSASDCWPLLNDWFSSRSVSGQVRGLVALRAKVAEVEPTLPPQNSKRALLIGVNKYQGENIPALAGCINDVFQVSAALQENGFNPEDIRVVLDERATSEGIRERLTWLLNDVREGDFRILYFSGHGVLLPVYNEQGQPDRFLDALVPHDFKGTLESAITDRDLAPLYERLPFDSRLILAFDCCRSKGTGNSRSLGATRQFDLPDDIRHRMLRWNADEQMWEVRQFPKLIPAKASKAGDDWWIPYSGKDNCTERLGRSVSRRRLSDSDFDSLRKKTSWKGPYLPVIIEACKEDESASEYLHGQVSYGAFSFAFCHVLHSAKNDGKQISFTELVNRTSKKIQSLGYPQNPEILGPSNVIDTPIPFGASQAGAPAANRKGKRRK